MPIDSSHEGYNVIITPIWYEGSCGKCIFSTAASHDKELVVRQMEEHMRAKHGQ